MRASVEIIEAAALHPLLDRQAVLGAVRNALIAHARGQVEAPLPGQLLYPRVHGDCHVKLCAVSEGGRFIVKVAAGFCENPQRGVPVSNGLLAMFDATTGAPQMIFMDQGWLTAWRTAAAAALAAHALAPRSISAIGIIGTGLQASLATQWLPETLGPRAFVIHGRDSRKAEQLAREVGRAGGRARRARDIDDLFATANVIVTATRAHAPLFPVGLVPPGVHIVAIGADAPGKQELPEILFSRATLIATDDHEQCLRFGDFGIAVRAGACSAERDVLLGNLLSGDVSVERDDRGITVADLTGSAAQDLAIAELFARRLRRSGACNYEHSRQRILKPRWFW